MGILVYLLALAVTGMIAGAFGRLALPGPDPMSVGQTMAVGLAGSFLAGIITWGLFGRESGGILLSIFFSAGIVYMVRRGRGGGLLDPGTRRDDRS